jgi:hypothetical protein
LIAEDGYTLDIFDTENEAIDACVRDCRVEPTYIESCFSYLAASPVSIESFTCN